MWVSNLNGLTVFLILMSTIGAFVLVVCHARCTFHLPMPTNDPVMQRNLAKYTRIHSENTLEGLSDRNESSALTVEVFPLFTDLMVASKRSFEDPCGSGC